MHPQFTTDALPVEPIAAWIPAFPAFIGLALLLSGAWGTRTHIRASRALVVVLILGSVVRFLWMPIELHLFDGHEAEYFDIFRGERPLSRGSVMLYPALQWLYAGVGRISTNPWVLLSLSGAASLLSIAATYGIGRRLMGARSAWVAAAIVSIWGNHAFWATSAYNVALPSAFGLVAVWALLVCAEEETLASAALASGAAVLAVSMRVECALLAPVGLALWGLRRPQMKGALLGILGLGAVLSGVAIAMILNAGPLPGGEERGLALGSNLTHLGFWAPFDGIGALLIVPAIVLGIRNRFGTTLVLVLFLVGLHGAISTFNDAGFRHSVIGLWAIALLLGPLVEHRWGWGLLVLVLIRLGDHTHDVASRYYLSEEDFRENLSEAPEFPQEKLSDCVLICEDSRLVPEGQQRSHFNLLYPNPDEDLWAEKGCVYWVFGVQDARWSSRAVRDRALRVLASFEVEEQGRITLSNGYVGSVLKVMAPQ